MTPVQQIRQHALDNYNNGWDYIVECYTDAEIQEEYLDACGGDVTKAIALIQEEADYRNEQSEEARREIEANTGTEEGTPLNKLDIQSWLDFKQQLLENIESVALAYDMPSVTGYHELEDEADRIRSDIRVLRAALAETA